MFEEPDGATPLGPDEIQGLKFKHITTRGELDELEQANIQEALLWINGRKRGDILQEEFVRTLHRRMFGGVWDWAGTFRQREMNIGIEPVQIAQQLTILLGNASYWVDEHVFEPLEAAARFHHRMVEIHPFPNGNGRHARIAADVFLKQYYDHRPIDWARGQDLQLQNDHRDQYIASLQAADGGNFEPILTFVGAIEAPQ